RVCGQRVQRAGEHLGPPERLREQGALLVGERDEDRLAGELDPVLGQGLHDVQPGQDAVRAVQPAAVRHGVEVGADEQYGTVRRAGPPGTADDHIARGVHGGVEAAEPRLLVQPLPRLQVGGAEPGPADAAAGVAPDPAERLDAVEEPARVDVQGHVASPSGGTATAVPLLSGSSATEAAISGVGRRGANTIAADASAATAIRRYMIR